MRYSADIMKLFWGVGLKLFSGRFVHLMTGMKNESAILTGSDILDPREAKINFAFQNENVLCDINPFGEALPAQYKPGFLEEKM